MSLLINIAAVWINYGKTQASGYAIASLIASIWAFGIITNYSGDSYDTPPPYAYILRFISGISGLALLIIGLVIK